MKTSIRLLGLGLLLGLLLPAGVQAQFTFTTNTDGTLKISGYYGPGGNVVFPQTTNGLLVTSIDGIAFDMSPNVTSVTIPASMTNIPGGVFSANFSCFTTLTRITVNPANPAYSSVDGVFFDKNQTILFKYPASKLGSIYTITNTVNTIQSYAFDQNNNLANVTISDSVTNMGEAVFYQCANLATITLPHNITSIPSRTFEQCVKLNSITIPSAVTMIGGNAFYQCYSLSDLTIPSSVNSIGGWGFASCTNLASVTFSNGITSIADRTFDLCTSLTNVAIPASVTSIGGWAFGRCASLISITVDMSNSVYSSVNGVLFDKNQNTLIQYPSGKVGGYTIPSNVISIGGSAFRDCSKLSSITIPDNVTSIGGGAFSFCSSLFNVRIPNSVTNIGGGAFSYCASLTNVSFPNSVTSIEGGMFLSCTSLTNFTFPMTLNSIGSWAFAQCLNLTGVIIPAGVTNIGDYAYSQCASLTGIYFKGDAPNVGSHVFDYDNNAIAYYLPGTTGWSSTIGGYYQFGQYMPGIPAILWNPQVQTNDDCFGIRTNQFGFTITGTTNIPIVVEACTNLSGGTWTPLQTNTLTGDSFYFSDPQWTNYPTRLYRLRAP